MKKVIIIAEAGVNHNGSIDNAKKLIDTAAEAGADYVKFQTFKTELNLNKIRKKSRVSGRDNRNGRKPIRNDQKIGTFIRGFSGFKKILR